MSELSLRELRDQVLNKKSPSKKPVISDVPTPKVNYSKATHSVHNKAMSVKLKDNKGVKLTKSESDQCMIIIPDVHSYERDVGGYELAMEAVKVISDTHNVTKVVQLGDLMECGELSGHPPSHVKERVMSYIDELDWAMNDFWTRIKKNSPDATYHGLLGNHENRINSWLLKNIGRGRIAESMYNELNPVDLYNAQGIQCIPYGEENPTQGTLEIFPKLYCLHGWSFAENAAAVHLAKVLGSASIIHGHTHRYHMTSKFNAITGESVGAWSFPALAKTNMLYSKGIPTNHTLGFGVVYTHKNSFSVNVMLIHGTNNRYVMLPNGSVLST